MKRKSKDDEFDEDVDIEEEEALEWGSGSDDQDYGDVIGGEASTSTRPQRSAQSKGKGKERETSEKKSALKKKGGGFSWEGGYDRTWDMVVEDDDGSLESTVNELLLSNRIKRVLLDTASIQRGIIRHVYLVIDLSLAMNLREFKKSWLDLTIQYTKEFITEFFDQNPISQLAIIGTREGTAERISPLSGELTRTILMETKLIQLSHR